METWLFLAVLILDICAVIIRVSSGEWSAQAKLSLLSSHLVLLTDVVRNMHEQMRQ